MSLHLAAESPPQIRTEPFTSEMERAVRRRDDFALLDLADGCAVAQEGDLVVVPVSCLRESGSTS